MSCLVSTSAPRRSGKCAAEHARPGARNSAVEPIHSAGIGSGEGINPPVREAPSPGCGDVMSPSPIHHRDTTAVSTHPSCEVALAELVDHPLRDRRRPWRHRRDLRLRASERQHDDTVKHGSAAHAAPALSYRTPRYDTKLQATRPREAGHWTATACAPPACHRDPHPAEPLHTGRLAADAARVVGGRGMAQPYRPAPTATNPRWC